MARAPTSGGVLDAARHLLEVGLGCAAGALMAGMVILVFANVVGRYVFSAAIGWSEEVSRFLFIWMVLLGAVLAFARREHVGLDLLVQILPGRWKRLVVVAADLVVVAALAFLTRGGVEMTADSLESGWVSSAVPIPYGYVYLVVPLGAGLMLLLATLRLVGDLRAAPPPAQAGQAGARTEEGGQPC